MDIHNVTEFKNFVTINQLRGLHKDIDAAAVCLMDYERGCDCWKGNARQKIYNNCKILYERAVGTSMNFKAHFLAHTGDMAINFSQDGRSIGSMRR